MDSDARNRGAPCWLRSDFNSAAVWSFGRGVTSCNFGHLIPHGRDLQHHSPAVLVEDSGSLVRASAAFRWQYSTLVSTAFILRARLSARKGPPGENGGRAPSGPLTCPCKAGRSASEEALLPMNKLQSTSAVTSNSQGFESGPRPSSCLASLGGAAALGQLLLRVFTLVRRELRQNALDFIYGVTGHQLHWLRQGAQPLPA